jgi:hypothetical protein
MDLIDRVVSNLKTDYATIEFHTNELHKNLGDKHLDWSLAHMSNSMLELIRDLQRHQNYLNEDRKN